MKERRLENRFLCADLVQINWVTGPGEFRRAEGVLEDISRLGACVQLEEAVPLGALISIIAGETNSGNETWLSGFVTYCVHREYGYFVGIHFADDTTWSSSTFEPQHLTNLAALSRGMD